MIIFLTIVLIPLALTIAGSFTFWRVNQWYDFYKPLVLLVGGIIAMFIIWIMILWVLSLFVKKENHKSRDKFGTFWLEQGHELAMILSNVRIKVNNRNRLPRGQRYLLVCNHRSNFDSMVMTVKLKSEQLAFITKRSNYKIPFFGRFLYSACFYPVDRDNQIQSLEAFRMAGELITNNVANVGIFPEGTRQRDLVLSDFHEGVFNIAVRAKCPIVIVTVAGGEEVHRRAPFRPTTINIDILGVIPYEEIEGLTAKAISDRVHKIMEDHLERIDILRYQRQHKK